jgi:hypothetical protein
MGNFTPEQSILFQEIMNLVLLVNSATKHSVFLAYAGHVNSLDCEIVLSGWESDVNKESKKFYGYLSDPNFINQFNEIKEYLIDLYLKEVEIELITQRAEEIIYE